MLRRVAGKHTFSLVSEIFRWAVTEMTAVKGFVWGLCLVGTTFQFTEIIVFIVPCTGAFTSM